MSLQYEPDSEPLHIRAIDVHLRMTDACLTVGGEGGDQKRRIENAESSMLYFAMNLRLK